MSDSLVLAPHPDRACKCAFVRGDHVGNVPLALVSKDGTVHASAMRPPQERMVLVNGRAEYPKETSR